VSTQSYKVVRGTSKSSTTAMRTVMQTTDIPVTKGSKFTWREMWEIDVVSIMKEDFVERILLKRIRIVVSTGGYPR